MITLCQECGVVEGINLTATPGLSHGLCIDCMPEYLRGNKMSEEEINEFMKEYKGRNKNVDNGRD